MKLQECEIIMLSNQEMKGAMGFRVIATGQVYCEGWAIAERWYVVQENESTGKRSRADNE